MTNIADPFRDRAAAVAHNLEAEARAGALTDIGRGSIVMMVVAVMTAVGVAIQWHGVASMGNLVNAALALGCGLALRTYRSRFLAGALLLISLVSLAAFCLTFQTQGFRNGPGLLVLVAAFFAVRGTFRFATIEGTRPVWKAIALNVLAFVIYEIIAFTVGFFVIGWAMPDAAEAENETLVGSFIFLLFFSVMTLVCLQYLPFTRRATSISRANVLPAA